MASQVTPHRSHIWFRLQGEEIASNIWWESANLLVDIIRLTRFQRNVLGCEEGAPSIRPSLVKVSASIQGIFLYHVFGGARPVTQICSCFDIYRS